MTHFHTRTLLLRSLRMALLCAAGVGATLAAQAADRIFLKLDGITGDSTDERHRGEIDISSYSQAFRNSANFGYGSGAGAGRVSCGDITVLKNIDRSSPDLIRQVVTGRHIRSGVISFQTSSDQRAADYYSVTLNDILVDAIEQVDPQGEARLYERLSLKARSFRFSYRPLQPDGSLGAAQVFGWDCVSNSPF
jgi:type VI secretion system secreted protein Hcp